MELRRYWQIFKRRWPLVLVPAVVVLVLGIITYQSPHPVYTAGVRFIVGQTPAVGAELKDEQRYYNWLTSEYIVNGLTDWVRGGEFAAAVSRLLAAQGHAIPAVVIQSGLAADNARSMLSLTVTGSSTLEVGAMMDGVITVLTTQNAAALPQLGGENAYLTQLDDPSVNQAPTGLRSRLDLPLRVLLALFVGVALALLVEYVDPTIRDRQEVEELGLNLVGEIPKK